MKNNKSQFVYMTILTNESYIPGCMALARSLVEVNSQYKLSILVPEDKKDALYNQLEKYGLFKTVGDYCFIETQPNITLPEKVLLKDYYWNETFFKLQVVRCYHYKKIIFIDSDQMLIKNIDHLFDRPHMTATICGKCLHPDWLDLTSGLMVIEPNEVFYNHLVECVEPAVKRKYDAGQNVGDQDVFHQAMPEWRDLAELHLPEKYDIFWSMIEILCKTENISTDEFYMIHFQGKEKPWHRFKYYYIWIFIRYFLEGKREKLFYKVRMYGKYRRLCCPKK